MRTSRDIWEIAVEAADVLKCKDPYCKVVLLDRLTGVATKVLLHRGPAPKPEIGGRLATRQIGALWVPHAKPSRPRGWPRKRIGTRPGPAEDGGATASCVRPVQSALRGAPKRTEAEPTPSSKFR